MVAQTRANGHVAIVAGARTPWVKAGADLATMHVTDLARTAMTETLYRAGVDEGRIDEVILGNVVMPADAANPARVAASWAGIPHRTPALTVQRNCASGLEAIVQAAAKVRHGEARMVLAGGAESMSTIPLLLPTEATGPMTAIARAKGTGRKLAAAMKLRPRHLQPRSGLELGLTDPTCGLIMGKTAEVLAHEFSISREVQDEYALRSHKRAVAAAESGRFKDEIVPVYAGAGLAPVARDIGPRLAQSMAALADLRPIFDRRDGTITVGNACQVTDGAAAVLVADGPTARDEGRDILGYINAAVTVGVDPIHMGLAPVFAIDRLLHETGLILDDIELFEINEAFAAQVLACLRAMASARFGREHLNRNSPLGDIDPQRLNVNGGAIALGHPVGATGTRLVLTLLLEMRRRDLQRGVAALCVGGGQGAAILVERS